MTTLNRPAPTFRPLPRVSVSVITYNQRDLIGRALNSVLMQRTTFPFEIIVGDDCSTDGTQDILRQYAARHPDIISLILHPRRYSDSVPGRTNNITNLINCRGKYTAMLDGDDYWTDPYKLQKQYDRMEGEPDLALCLHNSLIEYTTASNTPDAPTTTMGFGQIRQTGTYSHADIAEYRKLTAQISTAFFRTGIFGEFPVWFERVVPADYALQLLISSYGKVYYCAEPMAAYTINNNGFTQQYSCNETLTQRRLADTALFAREFPATQITDGHERGNAYLYFRLVKYALRRGNLPAVVQYGGGLMNRHPGYVWDAMRRAGLRVWHKWAGSSK